MGIRFIDLSEKLGCFAFYETTVDRFLEYSEQQTWTSWSSFELSWRNDPTVVASCSPDYLKAYCADWVFEKAVRKLDIKDCEMPRLCGCGEYHKTSERCGI